MISFRNLALRRGGHLLLTGVDATLYPGWRVGVVGRNGCGKSSLFAAMDGELDPDQGSIDMPARLRLASVAQETPGLPDAAVDFVLGGDAELAAALAASRQADASADAEAQAAAHLELDRLRGYDGPARAARLLHGLGFPADTHARPVEAFSGGWRMRLNLARALMAPSDLLLLDEPTNHLDLDAVLWLEDWLTRYEGTLLVISHDREFLDGVCTHTLHLHDGRAKLYSGDYTSFERQRAEQLRQQQISHEREQAVRAHLQSFVDRFRAKATKAKQAQSRLKRIEKLAGTEAVRAESPFRFAFATPPKLPSPLLRLDGVVAGYPPSEPGGDAAIILEGVRFSLEPGDRVALLGPNGAGKSTLVKTIAGELAPLAGERLLHGDARIGYFTQHTVDSLTAGESPVDHLARIAPGRGEQVWRNWLGQWNFAGERVFEPVDGFSGGERARLALSLIAWHKPSLLLLDEPTNHLDLDMREALAEALAEFSGALVLVSHDRHLIGMVCDSFWRVADGAVERFDGDLDDYARWLRTRRSDGPSSATPTSAPPQENARERRRAAAEQRERQRPLRQRMALIEKRLAEIDSAAAIVAEALSDPALYEGGDAVEIASLGQQQAALSAERDALEHEWLELGEQLSA
jgi:ATP-binding cassette, subfamily F, member 3